MEAIRKVFGFVLLMALLLAPLSAAAGLTPQAAFNESALIVMQNGSDFNASILVFDTKATLPPMTADENRQLLKFCSANMNPTQCLVDEAQKRYASQGYTTTFSSIQGANITFEYYHSLKGWIPITDCGNNGVVTADQAAQVNTAYTDPSGNFKKADYYYASCRVPSKLYAGRKIAVRVLVDPKLNPKLYVKPTAYTSEVTDNDFNALTVFSTALSDLFAPQSQGGGGLGVSGGTMTGSGLALPCIGIFMILGLLLASMYFAGKTPVSLLDITTPRLPSPKSFAAGGQILAPFGYTEMKKTIKDKNAKALAILGLEARNLRNMKGSSPSQLSQIDGALKGISGSSKTAPGKLGTGDIGQSKKFFEVLALEAGRAGVSWNEVKGLAKHMYDYTDADNRNVRKIIDRIQALGGRHKLMAGVLDDQMQATRLWQSLEVLTAHPDIGTRSAVHQATQTVLGKAFAPGRFPSMGPLVLGGVDSTVRSGRVLGRMAKGIAVHGAEFARDTGRWAVDMRGPQAMERLRERARDSRAAEIFYNQITKKPSNVALGGMFPVHDKMGYLYETLGASKKGEAYADMMAYVLKRIYGDRHSVRSNFNEEAIVNMAIRDVDVLARAGYRHGSDILLTDARIRGILMDGELNREQKFNRLVALAKDMNVHLDPRLMTFANELRAIEGRTEDGYVKLASLHALYDRETKATHAAAPDEIREDKKWAPLLTRQSLHGSDLWDQQVYRGMVHNGEMGTLHGGVKEAMEAAFLYNVNRLTTLNPFGGKGYRELPAFMQDEAGLRAVQKRVKEYLLDLMTEEGKAKFTDLTKDKITRPNGIDPRSPDATVSDFMNVLYGYKALLKAQGAKWEDKDLKAAMGAHEVPGTGGKVMWWGEDKELGPAKGDFKLDMKRHWIDGLQEREAFALGQWVNYRFTKGYVAPYKASIEADLNDMARYPGARTWSPAQRSEEAKKLWVRDQIKSDLVNFANSTFCQNAYGTTHETMRFYTHTAAGFLLDALRKRGYGEEHPDVRFLQTFDHTNPTDMKYFRKTFKNAEYKEAFEEALRHQMTYSDVSRSSTPWVMMAEGGFAPAAKGLVLSGQDRPLNCVAAMRDEHGQWKRVNLDHVQVALPTQLQAEFNRVAYARNPEDWKPFLSALKDWAKGGDFNAKKQFAAVVHRFSTTTSDYVSFQHDTGVHLVAKRDATSLPPNILQFFNAESEVYSKVAKPFRNFFLNVGDYVSRVALTAGGPLHSASYDFTPISELYRQRSWRLAQHIMTQKWQDVLGDVKDPEEQRQLKQAYRAMGMAHGAYHQVWDYSCDRHPGRHDTSYGGVGTFSSYFQFGPSKPFPVRANLRAYMDRMEYTQFMAFYGWPMKLAQYPFQPFVNMFRGAQMAMQGYPNRWSLKNDPLRQYYYTAPRLGEAVQSVVNPLSSMTDKYTDKLNIIKGGLKEHHLSGEPMELGMRQHWSDIQVVKKGVYSTARTGEANPGASAYSYRFTLELDQMMAEYLMYRSGGMSSYYAADPYVRGQALTNTVRRNVSAEALAMRREQELMGFGAFQNSIMGFSSPLMFAYHMPVPGLTALSPKELLTSYVNKARSGGRASFVDSAKNKLKDMYYTMGRTVRPDRAHMVAYCECGCPCYKGSVCRKCGTGMYM